MVLLRYFPFLILSFIATHTWSQRVDVSELSSLLEFNTDSLSPGVALGIVKDGEIFYEVYKGLSNLEHRVPVNVDTRFNIASNAKQFTAMCIMKLVSEGKVSLNEDVRKYISGIYPKVEEEIPIATLINHSSGIRDYSDLMGFEGDPWWKRLGADNDDVIELLKNQEELNFSPGSDYGYSNSNFTLLAKIVEEITGKKFHLYAEEFFVELGMNQTIFSSNYMKVIPNKALPYSDWGDGVWKQYPMLVNVNGDGFLYTTLRDQLHWESILQNNESKTFTSDELQQSQRPVNTEIKTYGFGVEFAKYKGKEVIYHAGSTGSYGAYFLRFPSEKLSIVAMSNNGQVWTEGLVKAAADSLLDLKEIETEVPQPIEATSGIDELTGLYLLDGETYIEIVAEGTTLFRKIYGRDPVELLPLGGNLYEYKTNSDLKLHFIVNESGSYDFKLYYTGYADRLGTRLNGEEYVENDQKLVPGIYINNETNASFDLAFEGNQKFKVTFDGRTSDALSLHNDLIISNRFVLKLVRDDQQEIEHILLDYARLKNVRFVKQDK